MGFYSAVLAMIVQEKLTMNFFFKTAIILAAGGSSFSLRFSHQIVWGTTIAYMGARWAHHDCGTTINMVIMVGSGATTILIAYRREVFGP
ncbi:hypothetical protein T484DRAFT_1782256 [Baffinella frigidus]|nr:hypothetical protein T484DRAFT_1782256 [Cryptophyta sp. CCMP2293]